MGHSEIGAGPQAIQVHVDISPHELPPGSLRDVAEIPSDNAEDFKQGAKIDRASVSRRECVGTLLKIPLC